VFGTFCTYNIHNPSLKFFPKSSLNVMQYLNYIPQKNPYQKSPEKINYPELKCPNKEEEQLPRQKIDSNLINDNPQVIKEGKSELIDDVVNRCRQISKIGKEEKGAKQELCSRQTSVGMYKTIGEIIPKVIKWRSMCYVEYSPNGQKIVSKEHAAQTLRIKKKSFDDYQLFLRLGIASNFDFKSHLEKSFNFLRKYVKAIRPRIPWKKTIDPDIESLLGITENSNS